MFNCMVKRGFVRHARRGAVLDISLSHCERATGPTSSTYQEKQIPYLPLHFIAHWRHDGFVIIFSCQPWSGFEEGKQALGEAPRLPSTKPLTAS